MRTLTLILVVASLLFGWEVELPGTYKIYKEDRDCQKVRPLNPMRPYTQLTRMQERALQRIYDRLHRAAKGYARLYRQTEVRLFKRRHDALRRAMARLKRDARRYGAIVDATRIRPSFYVGNVRQAFERALQLERGVRRVIDQEVYRLPPFMRGELESVRRKSERAQRKIACVLEVL